MKYLRLKDGIDASNKFKESLSSRETREGLLQNIVKSVFSNLTLFYESLQALVEGRRDVLHNENFRFEDGKTVKEKQEAFEKYL